MKYEKKICFFITLFLCLGIWASPVRASTETSTDVEEISVEKKVNYLIPGKAENKYYKFTAKSQGKWIPIKPQAEGILCIGEEVQIYDKNKKPVSEIKGTEDQNLFIPNVKTEDIFYLKLPDRIEDDFTVYAYMNEDSVKVLQNDILYSQSGKNKNIYQEFRMKCRGKLSIYVQPVCYNDADVTLYVQRKDKDGWKTVVNTWKVRATDHTKKTMLIAQRKGTYRLVSKAASRQLYQIHISNKDVVAKYQTKKSKAQKIKLRTTKSNIYTATEKASRWYRVYRKTAKYKRYVRMSVNNNSGAMKFTIYKKGRSKAVASYTLKGNKSKTYRLRSGRGTYYVKVSKIGSRMNGQYSIQYK